MEMVINGDVNKVSILFERYHVQLYNFFYKKNYDQNLSEDLTQNVFERIIQYANSFDTDYPFRAWMFKIARNIVADHFGKKNLEFTSENDWDRTPSEIDTVAEQMEQKENLSILQQAIDSMTEEDREIIHFTRFQKLKYHEIAPILGISESGVKMRVHRAMKKLKEQYLKLDRL